MYDERSHTEQWLHPRPRGRKTLAQIEAEESRKRAIARGGKVPLWDGLVKPVLLWLAGILAFLLGGGLLNAILTGHS